MSPFKPILSVGALIAGLLHASSSHAGQDDSITGEVYFATYGNMVEVTDSIISASTGQYRVSLIVEKSGHNGRLRSKQSKEIDVEAGETIQCNQVSIGAIEGDQIAANLLVEQDGKTIWQTSKVLQISVP